MTFAKELPSGWESVKLGKLVDISSGFSFKSKLFKHEGFPIIRIGNINNGYISDKNLVYFDPDDYKKDLSKFIINPGDIIIAMSGATVGKIAFNNSSKTYFQNQRISNIKPKINSNISKRFLYYFLSLESKKFLSFSVGSAQPNLNNEYISKLIIKLPPLEVQEKIVEILDKAERLKELREESTKKSEELRKSIFQKQVIKKITVDNLPSDWIKLTMDEIAENTKNSFVDGPFGSNLKVSDYVDNGIKVIRVENIGENKFIEKKYKFINEKKYNEISRSNTKHGDIVFAKMGEPICRSAMIPDHIENAVIVADCIRLRVNKDLVDSKFLLEYMNSDFILKNLFYISGGSTRARVSLGKLKKFQIYLPPKKIQKNLMKKISVLDEIYYKNKIKFNESVQLNSSLLQKAFNGEL